MAGKLDWLKEKLKCGDIKIQGDRSKREGTPNARGVMKLHDGTILEISLWTTRTGENSKILTGKFYTEEEAEKMRKKKPPNQIESGINSIIPD